MRALALLYLSAAGLWCQIAVEANKDYATPGSRAQIIQRLESPARLARIRPAELISALDIAPGSTVIDLGTGTGNLLEALSRAVGPTGRVIAEDIHDDFLNRARERAKSAKLRNVQFVLGSETDPHLPPGAADLVIVLDAYHHFDYPEQMLKAIRGSLRPGGRLAIVEYHKKRGAMEVDDPDFAIKHVRASAEQVEVELKNAGYQLLWRRDHAPDSQYIAMFRR